MTIEEGTFIEIDYTARTTEDGEVFDTTEEDVADEAGLDPQGEHSFEPMVVCVGEGHIIKGLDDALVGKDLGSYEFDLTPEEAFGEKDEDMVQLIPESEFEDQDFEPRPGRVVVDFNHPLSGHDINYNVTINRIVEDEREQAEAIFEKIQMPYEDLTIEDGTATVTVRMQLPDEFKDNFTDEFERLTGLDIEFDVDEENAITAGGLEAQLDDHDHDHDHDE
jgi:FKBP-type peptidyl-prolyl cis-trans isomerase 2